MSTLRFPQYSPFNYLVVDWSTPVGDRFNLCGLPQPRPCVPDPECRPTVCRPIPIQEAIDTYDWARWLPEVIVGIEDPDEEIAAAYVREAAIEFCRRARALQRVVTIETQPGVNTYPIFPYDEERLVGVLGFRRASPSPCWADTGGCCSGVLPDGLEWMLDVARNEIEVSGHQGAQILEFRVWVQPTEDACVHDVFLYEHYRSAITAGARLKYATAVHFRDRALMASLISNEAWDRSMILAKTKTYRGPSAEPSRAGTLFTRSSGCCPSLRGRRY